MENMPGPKKESLSEIADKRQGLRNALKHLGVLPGDAIQQIKSGKKPQEVGMTTDGFKMEIAVGLLDELAATYAKAEKKEDAGTTNAEPPIAFAEIRKTLTTERGASHSQKIMRGLEEKFGDSVGDLSELRDEKKKLGLSRAQLMADSFRESNKTIQKTISSVVKKYSDTQKGIEMQMGLLEHEQPVLARSLDLAAYQAGLSQEGHIAPLPSTLDYVEAIENSMISGKPMLLHGPTGTGKTSLARFASHQLGGCAAEMVWCSPQFRESSVWGKTGIEPTADGKNIQTVEIYGPLTRAMRDGNRIIFDEFTMIPKEQMGFIKGVFNKKVGDTVDIPGNGKITVHPGFQMIFTANLKSEKNPERQDLPPEMASEFEQNNLEIGYAPKHESYDTMLARLMNPDGSIDASWHDLRETLPKLAEAIEEIQIAYTGTLPAGEAKKIGAMDVSGKLAGLKKMVMGQRTIEAMLDGWNIERIKTGGSKSMVEFLDERLTTGLTFKEYPAEDRLLAAKILASKGLLRTVSAENLGLPRDAFDFAAAKSLRTPEQEKSLIDASKNTVTIPLHEIATLDPFGMRVPAVVEEAKAFRKEKSAKKAKQEMTAAPEQIVMDMDAFWKDTCKSWGTTMDVAMTFKPTMITPENHPYKDLAEAPDDKTKFGEYFLNPETQNLPFEQLQPFIPDLSAYDSKKLHEVFEHVAKTYGDTYYIPGIEYQKWLFENPTKIPQELKDGNYYYLPGSSFVHSNGRRHVPCGYWGGAEWDRNGHWLDYDWASDYRVVLLPK